MPERRTLLALAGDGIGPEVTACALKAAEAACDRDIRIEVAEDLLHGAAWDAHGVFCRDRTVEAALAADAVLVGAVGGPRWDGVRLPGPAWMQDGLMRLRHALDAWAGLRPARAIPCLAALSPYRPEVLEGADVLVLREMTGGPFFASERGVERPPGGPRRAWDHGGYDEAAIARLAHAGFRLARRRRGRLASVDKANAMETYALWREVVGEIAACYPDIAFEHILADNASYRLARDPRRFDVMIADNLLGDLLSDQAGVIAGGLGMLPSACLRAAPAQGEAVAGIYEPVHGSAPDIAGRGVANPLGAILSVAMMFEHSFVRPDIARRIEAAVTTALDAGCRTVDLGGAATSAAMTDAVIAALNG